MSDIRIRTTPLNRAALCLVLLVDAVCAIGYLTGEPYPVVWRTQDAVDACTNISATTTEMLLAVPDGIRLSLTVPDTVYAGEPTPATVEFKLKASLAVDIIAHQSNYMLPHINIHSCFASIGACTPFIKNNPELSTHTPAVSRNLTTSVTSSGDWTLTESIEITLDEGSYMIIGHVRYFTAVGKFDVAYGMSRYVQPMTAESDNTVLVISLLSVLGVFVVLLLLYGMYKAVRNIRKGIILHAEQVAADRLRLWAALESVQQCKVGVCFISLKNFKQAGQLRSHEQEREAGHIVFLDTYEDVLQFCGDNHTAFISHQWTGRDQPDPDNLQYPAMCDAMESLCITMGLDHDKFFIWVDYISIPQKNKTLQALSISSLSVYASMCQKKVIVAPHIIHENGHTCDRSTYQKRGWCRMEQWARLTNGSSDQMYLYDANTLSKLEDQAGWIRDSMQVFSGDFTYNADKEQLVEPSLGLYGMLLSNEDEGQNGLILQLLLANKSKVFPLAYFGELPTLLEHALKTSQEMKAQFASASSKKRGRKDSLKAMWAGSPSAALARPLKIDVMQVTFNKAAGERNCC